MMGGREWTLGDFVALVIIQERPQWWQREDRVAPFTYLSHVRVSVLLPSECKHQTAGVLTVGPLVLPSAASVGG